MNQSKVSGSGSSTTAGLKPATGRLLVFPDWGENPYLNLLGLAPRADGLDLLGAVSYEELLLALPQLGHGDVLHIHWTTPLLQFCKSARSARLRLRRLSRSIHHAKVRGIRIVWTIHNRLPHEVAHRDEEISLYRLLAEKSDLVLVMAPSTPGVMSDIVDLEASKTAVLPHPSYEGIYETGVTRGAARASFDLAEDEHAVLFVGQIRPYKGVTDLVRAVARAERPTSRATLLLGGVVKEMDEDEFGRSLPRGMRSILQPSYIPDADLARWFRAADVVVLPYRSVLNSGSLHLAATFAVPVILPDLPHLVDQFGDQQWVAFFDRRDAEGSIAALLSDETLFADLGGADFEAFLDTIAPWDISRQYSGLLRELITAS